MATQRVVCVYYLKKKSLVVINNETFSDIAVKIIQRPDITFTLECSTNDRDWIIVDEHVLSLPAIGVIDSFSYKYIRIAVIDLPNNNKKRPTDHVFRGNVSGNNNIILFGLIRYYNIADLSL